MQRFIKTLAYGLAATALTLFTVGTADAQRGGGGRGGSNGGSKGASMGGGFKGGSMGNSGSKGSPPRIGNGQIKQQGPTSKPMTTKVQPQNGPKNGMPSFAKGEPNPSAKGGFKHPGQHHNQKFNHNPSFKKYNDFCGTPWGGKYHCNNWNWKGSNWGYNCGYPSWGNYCYPKTHCYPSYGYCYPTYAPSYCFTPCYTTPVCYTQTIYVPTVVQQPVLVAPPVEEVVTSTTVAKTTTQQVVQPADLSFLTGSVFNQ